MPEYRNDSIEDNILSVLKEWNLNFIYDLD